MSTSERAPLRRSRGDRVIAAFVVLASSSDQLELVPRWILLALIPEGFRILIYVILWLIIRINDDASGKYYCNDAALAVPAPERAP